MTQLKVSTRSDSSLRQLSMADLLISVQGDGLCSLLLMQLSDCKDLGSQDPARN